MEKRNTRSKTLVKGRFLWKQGEERAREIQKIRNKIESGYFSSRKVLKEVVERVSPQFHSVLDIDT